MDAAANNEFEYEGIRLVRDRTVEKEVMKGATEFVHKAIEILDSRIPQSPILGALDIFNFHNMPGSQEEWDKISATYGNQEMDILMQHYGETQSNNRTFGNGNEEPVERRFEAVVNKTQALAEWSVFKHLLFKKKLAGMSLDEGYADLLKGEELESIKFLSCIYLVQILSTVWCERGFSLMAQIKTKLRNRLSTATLDSLMCIMSNGPSLDGHAGQLEELFEAAFEHWFSLCKRMPLRSHRESRCKKKDTDAAIPLNDLLRAIQRKQALAAKLDATNQSDSDSDKDDWDADDIIVPDDDDSHDHAMAGPLSEIVGLFHPPKGWFVLDAPSKDSSSLVADLEIFCWTGRRIAHIFDEGWATASHARKLTLKEREATPSSFLFRYKTVGLIMHNLELDGYGIEKTWVIIQKEGTVAAPDEDDVLPRNLYEKVYPVSSRSSRRQEG